MLSYRRKHVWFEMKETECFSLLLVQGDVSRCNFAMDYLGTFYLNPPHDIMLLDET